MDARAGQHGIGDLLGDLAKQVSALVRQELDLARSEIASSLMQAGRGAGLTGLGGVLIHAGFLALVAAAVLGLVQAGIDPWVAAVTTIAGHGPRPTKGRLRASRGTACALAVGTPNDEAIMPATKNQPMQMADDIPTEAYLAATGASILLSLLLYLTGKKQAAQFVGLWAPTIINLGLFAKLLSR